MSERDTIVKNLNEWASKLVAFDEAEKAEEVYVWLLRDGKVERVKVDAPDFMEQCLRENREYIFAPYCELIIHTKDEGVTWFRSEEAALEAQEKTNAKWRAAKITHAKHIFDNDDLISLREAGTILKPYGLERILDRLPRHPIDGKMVPWEKVKGWFCNQYGDCYISDKFRKHLGIGPDE